MELINDVKNFQSNGMTLMTEKLGSLFLAKDNDMYNKIAQKEEFKNITREDLAMSGNTVLYTTAVNSFIDQKLRANLIADQVLKKIDLTNDKGINSVKIPINAIPTATALTENTDISYGSNNYTNKTLTAGWVGAAQKFSRELLKASNFDIMKDQLGLIGYAIANKMNADIITELQTSAPNTDANNNYLATGGASTRISYDKFVDGIEKAENNNAHPDVMLMNPTDWAALMKDSDFKNALAFATTPAGSTMPQVQDAAGLKIMKSSIVTSGNTYLIDTKAAGYFADFSNVETYDGRIPDQISFEVIGAKAYAVGISQPESYVRIEMSA